jgi:hypothetical protein
MTSNLTALMDAVDERYAAELNSIVARQSHNGNASRVNASRMSIDERDQAKNYVGAFYNSILLFNDALRSLLTDPRTGALLPKSASLLKDATDGRKLTAAMRNRTVQGIAGKVIIDEHGNRETSYALRSLNPYADKYEQVARYTSIDKVYESVAPARIFWPDDLKGPPSDTPVCGWDDKNCQVHGKFRMAATRLLITYYICS